MPEIMRRGWTTITLGVGALVASLVMVTSGQQPNAGAPAIDNDDIGGVVTGARGPEARYYPAQYWYALMQMPPKSDFPGTGEQGNGISPNIHAQGEWIRNIVNTDGCTGCHQMGGEATRTIPKMFRDGAPDSKAAWD